MFISHAKITCHHSEVGAVVYATRSESTVRAQSQLFTHCSFILLKQKLPFTIPELVQASPCRSSDGVLYMGEADSRMMPCD